VAIANDWTEAEARARFGEIEDKARAWMARSGESRNKALDLVFAALKKDLGDFLGDVSVAVTGSGASIEDSGATPPWRFELHRRAELLEEALWAAFRRRPQN